MIKKLASLTLLLATTSAALAATSLQFSVSPNGATNFSDAAGIAGVNGMRWGVIISSTNSTFEGSLGGLNSYDPFDQAVSGFLSVGSVLTDDYYFANGGAVTTVSIGPPFFTGAEMGNGSITLANNVPSTGDAVPNVAGGDPFGLIWLASSTANTNDKYGFFTDTSFLLPATGPVNFSAAFAGADPIRAANLTVGGVPEPSRFLLIGLGCIGLLLRRRRS